MFRTIENKGFHIVFPNGICLSTQFGWGNYCGNYPDVKRVNEMEQLSTESDDVEIAIWDINEPRQKDKRRDWLTSNMIKDLFPTDPEDDVMGYVTIDMWLKIFDWCRNYKKSKEST